ncbi:MAG: DUF3494 domain-containing protein [Massilia sp.]|nr:DUF3494 domain-containing protein [Massilia sp.]
MHALKRYFRIIFCSLGFLSIALVSGCGGGGQGRDPILGLPAADVISVAVTPASALIDVGATQQYLAIATYTDGSSRDVSAGAVWTSATPAVATVNAATGLAAGVNAGTSVIAAAFSGKSGSATLTVNAATLQSIVVLPANTSIAAATSQQFVAMGTFSDNTTRDISALATFTSSTPAVASINARTGQASGLAAGTTTITATSGLQSASTGLTVTAIGPLPPSAPLNLRTAANFGVLAGTALTSNSGGTTLITGDVGSPSQTTDPAQAAGFTNYKSGAILDNALADLQSAISDANGRACGVNFAGGIDLGGATLAPGVYCYAGAISVTGTLTLSGPGVYIFRTASTLNTTANAIVQLQDGATADNVMWLPVGPTTLGANGVFKGSILGQAAAITVGDNTTLLNGRVLSGAAVTLRNNQIAK